MGKVDLAQQDNGHERRKPVNELSPMLWIWGNCKNLFARYLYNPQLI